MSEHAAVAATNPTAAAAALQMARSGGRAVDAAIAAMAVTMSTEPGMVSLGGGGYVAVWPVDGEPVVIDGNAEMPGRGVDPNRLGGGLMEVSTDYGGGLTMNVGPGSVATPGALAALGTAHEQFGRLSWADVLAPAIGACRDGFAMGTATASFLAQVGEQVYGWDAQTRPLVSGPEGGIVVAGDRQTNPDLAGTWEQLATRGWQDGYTGELARALADDQSARGGLITMTDLAAYQAVRRTPVTLGLGEWQVALNPPPSVGGPMLAMMLTELTRRGTGWRQIIDIQRAVLGYRFHVHDHSDDLEGDGHDLLQQVQRYGLESLPTSASTAHVSVVDSAGNACAITMSSGYGSGATVPGTGVMLNNSLGEPELNALGLHALAPGTRLASNMAPTTARTTDGRCLAIGSPGADRITTALMQVLARYCLLGLPLAQAIEEPRLHVRYFADGSARVDHEHDPQVLAAATESGLATRDHGSRSMYFGGVGAAQRDADGRLHAAADPRRESATAVA
ncbi:MAG: gamma-glutamyltransferase [Actinomycetales bacterium]